MGNHYIAEAAAAGAIYGGKVGDLVAGWFSGTEFLTKQAEDAGYAAYRVAAVNATAAKSAARYSDAPAASAFQQAAAEVWDGRLTTARNLYLKQRSIYGWSGALSAVELARLAAL